MPDHERVTILGAGVAGLMLACYLGKADLSVDLHEQKGDPRLRPWSGSPGLPILLSKPALQALEQVELRDKVLASAATLRGWQLHRNDGSTELLPVKGDLSGGVPVVAWAELHRILLDSLASTVRLHFDQRCRYVQLDTGTLELVAGQDIHFAQAGFLIGADGPGSVVRQALLRRERFDLVQEYASHVARVLTLPATDQLLPDHGHLWPRGDQLLIVLPAREGTWQGVVFLPHAVAGEVAGQVQSAFPDVAPLMPDLASQCLTWPAQSLVRIRCRPWHASDRALLLGDAAHAMPSFLGQGVNAALVSSSALVAALAAQPDQTSAAFASFEKARGSDTDGDANRTLAQFHALRKLQYTPWAAWRDRLRIWLHPRLPRWCRPRLPVGFDGLS